jgi:hypothetical protein
MSVDQMYYFAIGMGLVVNVNMTKKQLCEMITVEHDLQHIRTINVEPMEPTKTINVPMANTNFKYNSHF